MHDQKLSHFLRVMKIVILMDSECSVKNENGDAHRNILGKQLLNGVEI